MILTIFAIGVIFMAILLFLGVTQYSFPFLYLGFFIMLLLGLFITSEGIDFENGMMESPFGSRHFVTVYETHTMTNDPVVNIIGNVFFYFPLAAIVLTTLVAIRSR